MTQILCFGDSITYGMWDELGGWTQRLKENLTLKHPENTVNVYNLGIPGDTTDFLIKRLKYETIERHTPNEDTVFIFAIGLNDSSFYKENCKQTCPEERFKKNLELIIEESKKYSNQIAFLSLTPVDEEKLLEVFPNETNHYTNKKIEIYNSIIKTIANENELQFIDILSKMKNTNYEELLHDGIHPNFKGHELMFEIVQKELEI